MIVNLLDPGTNGCGTGDETLIATTTTDANGVVTESTYDRRGQVLTVVFDPGGLALYEQFSYDGQGNVLTETRGSVVGGVLNPLVAQTYQYDALGRRIGESGVGENTSYTFDANDNVTSFNDGNDNQTHWVYDSNDRLRYRIDPAGYVNETRYDAKGNAIVEVGYATPIATATPATESAVGAALVMISIAAAVTFYYVQPGLADRFDAAAAAAHLGRGEAYEALGDTRKAMADYQAAINEFQAAFNGSPSEIAAGLNLSALLLGVVPVGYLAGRVRRYLRSAKAVKRLNRSAGGLMIGALLFGQQAGIVGIVRRTQHRLIDLGEVDLDDLGVFRVLVGTHLARIGQPLFHARDTTLDGTGITVTVGDHPLQQGDV